MLLSIIGFCVLATSLVHGGGLEGYSQQELKAAVIDGVRQRLSPAHRLLLSEDDTKKEVEKAIAAAIAESIVLKAKKIQKAQEEGLPLDGGAEGEGEGEGETADTHISSDQLKELVAKWAKKLDEMKQEHERELAAQQQPAEPEATAAVVIDDGVDDDVVDLDNGDGDDDDVEPEDNSDVPPEAVSPDTPDQDNDEADDQGLSGGDNDAATDEPEEGVKHIVVNFSTESLINLWAIMGMILVINVILYCCYTRRKRQGQAYLARDDAIHDDV